MKFLNHLLRLIFCLALAVGLVRFGPNIYMRICGEQNARWFSERFTEALREKNELVVYEIETTGQETVSQDAWLIGTVQKVELPYTFQMSFTVDLSQATIAVNENRIEVHVPSPKPGYQKLTVDDNQVKKVDWLYPLTPERYAQIKQEVEDRLFAEYCANETYRQNAWNVAVRNLEALLRPIANQNILGSIYEIQIIEDQVLETEPELEADILAKQPAWLLF